MSNKAFPKYIHVTRDGGGEDSVLIAWGCDQVDVEETQPCALYQLVETGEVEVTKAFVSRGAPRRAR